MKRRHSEWITLFEHRVGTATSFEAAAKSDNADGRAKEPSSASPNSECNAEKSCRLVDAAWYMRTVCFTASGDLDAPPRSESASGGSLPKASQLPLSALRQFTVPHHRLEVSGPVRSWA